MHTFKYLLFHCTLKQEEGCQIDLHSVSPSDIKDMLLNILVQNLYELDFKTPLQQRQIDGALNRVPKDFYDRVWEILWTSFSSDSTCLCRTMEHAYI
jgi:hypothetical protein